MTRQIQDAYVVAATRTAVGKAPRGMYRNTRPDDLLAHVLRAAMTQCPGVSPGEVDDVIVGCAMPEAEQGMNVARMGLLLAGFPDSVAGMTINRFCSSGLQALALAADRIRLGEADVMIAAGTESMSMVPMGGNKVSPNPTLVGSYPDVYLSTGLVAENHARASEISREAQDEFALRSHQRAIAAIDAGRFKDEIVPVPVRVLDGIDRTRPVVKEIVFDTDEGPRRDTSLEALGKLRPAFHTKGTVTAGNSSQTSDGAAVAIVMSAERAKALGLTPMARFVTYATAGVPPEMFGIGPVPAIRKALKAAGLTLEQMDLVELNEAFASQALACLKELPIDPERLNVNGGAIALGHPLGCTGAKLTATLLHELARRKGRYGLVSMCVGGGMGAAGIFERV